MAEYFNRISHEFQPLEPSDIPSTYARRLPLLQPWEVAERIRRFRKPKSMVAGDLFPKLMTLFADLLAIPLTDIYNEITVSSMWPTIWKHESERSERSPSRPTNMAGSEGAVRPTC